MDLLKIFKINNILILTCIAILLMSCNKPISSNEIYYKFIDDNNNEIILTKKPNKVATLFSSFTDMWNLAGGVSDISIYESVERGFVNDGIILVDSGAGKTIDNELLIQSNPDFVICSKDVVNQVKTTDFLNDYDIPAACFHVETFADYLRVLDIFTDITGFKNNYIMYGKNQQESIENLLLNIDKKNNNKILFIRAGSSPSSTKAKGTKDHFAAQMLSDIGMINIADECKILLDGISEEEVLIQNPDYIFITTMGDEDAAKKNIESLFDNSIYSNLEAVKNKKYVFLPKDLFQYKPNARWYDAYLYLVGILYEE